MLYLIVNSAQQNSEILAPILIDNPQIQLQFNKQIVRYIFQKLNVLFGKSMHEVMPCYIYELNNES